MVAWGGTLQVEILDVGQGDSILVTSPAGKIVLIDGGTGRRSVMRALNNRQISSIDLMVNTHAHADHIGGLDEVLEALPVKAYVDSGMPHTTETYKKVLDVVESKGVPYKAVRAGQVFRLDDGIKIEVLAPEDPLLTGTRSDLNSNSVIMRIQHKKVCFLLMGDAELETEHRVLEQGLEPCEVLKVAHHGSRYASSKKFLTAVQPEWAAISVGRNNRYKHPAPEAVRRLERAGATVLRTDLHGRILFESNGRKVEVFASRISDDIVLPPGVTQKKPPRLDKGGAPPSVARTTRGDVRGGTKPDLRKPAKSPAKPAQAKGKRGGEDAEKHPAAALPAGKIDLNHATAEELTRVPGIGPAKAAAIISHRETKGPFQSVADVDAVPGIGPATLAHLEAHTAVASPTH
jgi:competence protein ComEC